MTKLSTLCYIEKDGQYLMLHRTVKKNDVNKDKWIGVGGHFEQGESPEECLLREVKEETGYTLTSWKYRGIVTFVYGEDIVEYMSLYTADGFEGELHECDEGQLEWVEKTKISALELWEGDKIFFRLLDEGREFFSLKLVYNTSDVLQYAALDGVPMELFDELDADNGASRLAKLLIEECTELNLFVGTSVNKAHKNSELSFDLSMRMNLVEQLIRIMKQMGKHVSAKYY